MKSGYEKSMELILERFLGCVLVKSVGVTATGTGTDLDSKKPNFGSATRLLGQ